MENASKALTMAAGVLIAILIIALIYVLINNISDLSQQDEQQLIAKQTAIFNKDFESYDRKLMRGVDLITVINKAIANNEKYENEQKIYDINIAFILKSEVKEVKVKVKNNKQVGKEKAETMFTENKKIELVDNKASDRINAEVRQFMKLGVYDNEKGYQIKYDNDSYGQEDKTSYTKIYNAYTTFKRKIFKCTKIGYSDDTGRVNYLEYEEIETSNLDGY